LGDIVCYCRHFFVYIHNTLAKLHKKNGIPEELPYIFCLFLKFLVVSKIFFIFVAI
jgi:hypothetical protein